MAFLSGFFKNLEKNGYLYSFYIIIFYFLAFLGLSYYLYYNRAPSLTPLAPYDPPTYKTVYLGIGFKEPGFYEVPADYTVLDVLKEYSNAYSNEYYYPNPTKILKDGERVDLKPLNSSYQSVHSSDIEKTGTPKDINKATKMDLMSVPGIGEKTAQKIIDYINENGPITSLDLLLNINGVGTSTLDNLKKFYN